jgi:phenylacetate-coenzyme A ligase PaaK-like adenylate-forming protein
MEERGKPLPIETLPRKELEKIQNRRLRYTLRKAYETTLFWREKFDSLGIKPDDVKNKEDLYKAWKKGLELTKEDLIKRYDDLLPNYLANTYYEELWTSGFGGRPKRIPYTKDSYKFIKDGYKYCFNSIGVEPGDKVFVMLAPFPYASGIHIRECIKNFDAHLLEMTMPLRPQQLLDIFNFYRPHHLWSLPTKLNEITSQFIEMGIDPSSFKLKSIGSGSEGVTFARKNKLSHIWKAPYFDEYASTECGIIGYQCEKGYLHVPEDRILFSVVDVNSKEMQDNEGSDLITCLYKDNEEPGIFLINYSHNDITKILDDKPCACGRTTLRIAYPKRVDEIINIGGVKLYARDIENVEEVEDYVNVLIRDEKTGKEKLEVRIVTKHFDKEIADKILNAYFSSNPPAGTFLYQVGEIIIKNVSSGELYQGLKILPGKPRRVFKIEKS